MDVAVGALSSKTSPAPGPRVIASTGRSWSVIVFSRYSSVLFSRCSTVSERFACSAVSAEAAGRSDGGRRRVQT